MLFVYRQEESSVGDGLITLTLEQRGVMARQYEHDEYRWTTGLLEQAEIRFGPS